jgi:transcriptional regulator with XRE-family HTH domain
MKNDIEGFKNCQKALAVAIKDGRKTEDLTQEELVSESGTDITSIRRMENESLNANPELASLFPVVRRLHIDANDFFYPEREKESPDLTKLLHYISTECTNEDARKLLPSIKTLLDMLHSDSMTDIKK